MILGKEMRVTLFDCNPQFMNSVEQLFDLIDSICKQLKVTIRSIDKHQFEPQGVSIIAILAESHCAIHTWPEHGMSTVDIFTCGSSDPIEVIPMINRASKAQQTRFEISERPAADSPVVKTYPNFPEYILREPPYGHFPTPSFRRGIGKEYILEPESVSWQAFFSSKDYEPPFETDILLLHPCSWAKPYDFSHYVSLLRKVTDGFPRVHRAIISNVGVVPYEYQMNELFCSYDYIDLAPNRPVEEQQSIVNEFVRVTAQRISNYIEAHRSHYKAVVILGHPYARSYQAAVRRTALRVGLPGFLVPTRDTYQAAKADVERDRDGDAPLFADRTLQELSRKLVRLLENVDRKEGSGVS